MKIGELSRRCNVSIRMLRYFEAEGLLQPRRTDSGYRDYSPLDEQTVARVQLLRTAGMTIATIKQFLPCIHGEGMRIEPCEELRTTLRDQLRLVDEKVEQLMQSRTVLKKFMLEVES